MTDTLVCIGEGLLVLLGAGIASTLVLCIIVIWTYIAYVLKEH